MNMALFFLGSIFSFASMAIPKYGPQEKPIATLLSQDFSYFQKNAPTDFWIILPHYQGMMGSHSASVASIVTAINSLRDPSKLTGSDENISEENILKLDPTSSWKRKISGKKPKGIELDEVSKLSLVAIKKYLGEQASAELLNSESLKKMTDDQLHQLLKDNEADANTVMVARYIQSAFTNDPEGAVGTYSTVGAYDKETKRVLIMETDRKYYAPYWVSLENFKKGLLDLKSKDGKHYLGGILLVHKM